MLPTMSASPTTLEIDSGDRPTEYWLNRVHQCDCIERMDRMPAGAVDLIVTSPTTCSEPETRDGG